MLVDSEKIGPSRDVVDERVVEEALDAAVGRCEARAIVARKLDHDLAGFEVDGWYFASAIPFDDLEEIDAFEELDADGALLLEAALRAAATCGLRHREDAEMAAICLVLDPGLDLRLDDDAVRRLYPAWFQTDMEKLWVRHLGMGGVGGEGGVGGGVGKLA